MHYIITHLLIVPCGIETVERLRGLATRAGLLIVPCGIETRESSLCDGVSTFLLIVPCGIETREPATPPPPKPLLIVPCGIETTVGGMREVLHQTFNRTLWN